MSINKIALKEMLGIIVEYMEQADDLWSDTYASVHGSDLEDDDLPLGTKNWERVRELFKQL